MGLQGQQGNKAGLIILVGVVFVVLQLLWKAIRRTLLSPLKHIPGPFSARLTTNYLLPSELKLERAYKLRSLHEEYGSVVRIGPNEVSISDWTAYREVYSQKGSSKTKKFYADTKLASEHNIFTMSNKEAHSARRKIQNPSYSQQAVSENESLISDKADILVRRLSHPPESFALGGTVNAFPLTGLFSLEVILACAFNRTYGAVPSQDALTLLRAMDASAPAVRIYAAVPWLSRNILRRIPGTLGYWFRQWDLWQEVVENLLSGFEQFEVSADKSLRFMATPLIVSEEGYLGRKLRRNEIVEELMGITFAGSGTTSTTLTYLLYRLAKHTEHQDRLREELKGVSPEVNQVRKLPFLNAVIKETMRLHPTIMSTLPRVLDRPLNVGKYTLPEGTEVGMQNYVHHRDADVYPQPDEFIPDRWLDEESSLQNMDAALTPFSLGPHNCIGQNLARAELYLATSKVIKALKLKLSSNMKGDDMHMEDRFNIAPKGRRLLLDVEVL